MTNTTAIFVQNNVSYLKEVMDSPLADSRLGLALAHKVLKVFFKALFVFQEAHGHIIICFTFIQLGEECPKRKVDRNGLVIKCQEKYL